MEEGRVTNESKKESKAVDKKETKSAAKKESNAVDNKGSKTVDKVDKKDAKKVDKKDAKTTVSKPAVKGETSAEVIAVKIQPNNYAVTCPGGGKACVGSRKEGVQTIPQPNKLPAPKMRRESAPSRIAGGRSSAPRV